jgi:O-methyltransferase involved in polyketide biosynthesis
LKTKINLTGVSETALLPLYARAVYSKEPYNILNDKKAIELVELLDYDFESLKNKTADSLLFCLARTLHFDHFILEHLLKYPEGAIIDIGCGFDTAFYRVDNGRLLWINADFHETMSFRENLFPFHERVKQTEFNIKDIMNIEVLPSIFEFFIDVYKITGEQVLYTVGGFFQYFDEKEVQVLLIVLACLFPKSEMIFDCIPKALLSVLNKEMNLDLKWGLDDAKELEKWSPKIKVVSQTPYFDTLLKDDRVPKELKDRAIHYSKENKSSIVHLRFG